MRSLPHLLLWCALCSVTPSLAATQIYRYTDDAGTLTFTNDPQSIPEQYRHRVVPLFTEITSSSGAVAPVQPQSPPEPVTRVVTVGNDYRVGARDSRSDAIRMAIESAKQQALEQVATYLEGVTAVRNLDITRDELRTYSAGIITVLDQRTSTRVEDGAVVIHVDLTAQIDQQEVIQAITALRDNDSARQELVALRTETDQLRQQLDAANQALAMAESPERIQALVAEREQVLNQMHAQALVSQAWTDAIYGPVVYAYPGIVFRQANGLLLQARQLHPENRHLHAAQQAFAARAGTMPSSAAESFPVPPRTSLHTHPSGNFPREASTLHQEVPSPSPLAAPLAKPTFPQIQPLGVPHGSLSQSSLFAPFSLAPTFPQIQPLGVPHGSLSQTPLPPTFRPTPPGVPHGSFPQAATTPTFPQIQPQGVPHGSLSQTPANQTFPQAAERFPGSSRGAGSGR